MRTRFVLIVLLLSSLAAITGCQQPKPGGSEALISGGGQISVQEMAALLGMRVDETTAIHVTLKNATNTVMLFTFAGGKVYVNAKPICEVGTVNRIAGQIYVPKSLVSQIRAAMSARPSVSIRKPSGCVVIDAGHGGKDPGATSCLGFQEKTVNLAVAQKVASLLGRSGVKAIMTRSSDTFIELEERAAVANRCDADLFVSIHADSCPNSSTRGFTIYVSRSASWSSRRAASAIVKSLAKTGLTSRGTQKADYRVLVQTRGPAVLIELGYLSNISDAGLLRDSSFQSRLAQAIARGISDFLGRIAL
ncbi:MAG: N-acetylmuramoyl-L-alanine amidase [Sedimentisphaerales bacterium]|nr:N-acetylmuramoyl-L-alanine amidase [Sedimentisphaerales bacterium]